MYVHDDRMNYRFKALIYRAGSMPISRETRVSDRCVRQPASTQSEQRTIDNLLDTSPQFKAALATLLRESKHDRKLSEYWQAVIDVALAASHASNVTAHSHSNSFELTISALTAPELLAELAPTDPLAGARLRGMKVKQELL